MSSPAVVLEGIGKKYEIGGSPNRQATLRDSLSALPRAALQKLSARASRNGSSAKSPTIWALRDISFNVQEGEVVGLIGRNGAGKSTLLKILSRITRPSEGRVELRGRVGSLLEVGTGFHPELTGRENIYLNGAILGMSRTQIDKKFSEIVGFAEIDRFLDTPVKHYSSGMYMRLAFSVAAHLDSDILLVDEVLAVGDHAFQQKCLAKMGSVAGQGRTVLFVSHNLAAVTTLCHSAILLEDGRIVARGSPGVVIRQYLSRLDPPSAAVDLRNSRNRRGSGEVRFTDVALFDAQGTPASSFKYGDDIRIEFGLEKLAPHQEMIAVVWIRTATGIPVLHIASHDDPSCGTFRIEDSIRARCVIRNCRLYPGIYSVSLWVAPSHYQDTDFVVDATNFRVEQGELLRRGFEMNWGVGVFHTDSDWEILRAPSAEIVTESSP